MTPPDWYLDSWKQRTALQQPEWPDQTHYANVLEKIGMLPPLVSAGEIRKLKAALAKAQVGEAFLLQGGDCAEEFARCNAPSIRETLKVILQMSVILSYAGEKHVIKVGRIAGQYAKPRSSPTETIEGVELPSFRGDIVNSPEPNIESRRPDANRLLEAYYNAAATLNILRAYTRGGMASLKKVHQWNTEFVAESPEGKEYKALASEIQKALKFMEVIGLHETPILNMVDFYTSHEALILGWESALTRHDSMDGGMFDCSGHMLWIGDRTRQLDGAHIEFMRGIENPIGMKIGPNHDIDDVRSILDRVNPQNEAGRITLITRFGVDKINDHLPNLLRKLDKEDGRKILWSSDPMHGNTYTASGKYKTRNFDHILGELKHFFEIHAAEGTIPGGIHFELTGEAVTECVGGGEKIEEHHLENAYLTSCDPRLNGKQSLDIAFLVAKMLNPSN